MKSHITRAGVVALLVVVSACGGGDAATTTGSPTTTTTRPPTTTTTTVDPNADLRAYVTAVMATEASPSEVPIDDDEAACISDATFDAVGAARFVEVGFAADSSPVQAMATFDDTWTDAEWATLIDGLFGCADMQQKLADSFLESGASQTVAECVSKGYFESGELRNGMLDRAEGEVALAALAYLGQLIEECPAG